jgi:hypothetical protein
MKLRITTVGSLFVGLLASAGLIALVIYVPPTMPWLALAIFLTLLAVMGFSAPIWRLVLRKLLPRQDDKEVGRMGWRFGLWTGVFVASLGVLKILGFADRVLILALLALLIMIEMFLQQNAARKYSSGRSRRTSKRASSTKSRKREDSKTSKKKT